jgi:hypothetical protein
MLMPSPRSARATGGLATDTGGSGLLRVRLSSRFNSGLTVPGRSPHGATELERHEQWRWASTRWPDDQAQLARSTHQCGDQLLMRTGLPKLGRVLTRDPGIGPELPITPACARPDAHGCHDSGCPGGPAIGNAPWSNSARTGVRGEPHYLHAQRSNPAGVWRGAPRCRRSPDAGSGSDGAAARAFT